MPSRQAFLATIGSGGDVYPMVALGAALRRRGWSVVFAVNPEFASVVSREALEIEPLGTVEDYRRAAENPELWHPTRGFRVVAEGGIVPATRTIYDAVARRRPHVVAASGLCFGARIAREKLGVPLVSVHLQPVVFRSVVDTPVMPGLRMAPWMPARLKRWLYRFVDAVAIDPVLARPMDAFRRQHGLAEVRRFFGDWMHSPDRVVGFFPEWFAAPQPDWPPNTLLTGFVDYDGAAALDPELAAWLENGDPAIAVTPGSAMLHGHGFLAEAVAACSDLGRRAVVLTRHPEQLPSPLPPGVRHVPWAPFRTLLRRVAAVVHHGGIGTMAQGFAAGIPQLVMPMGHDQPDNAARLGRLGVGTGLPPKRWRRDAIAARLEALLGSKDVLSRAREIAMRVDFDVAVERAADAVELTAGEAAGT